MYSTRDRRASGRIQCLAAPVTSHNCHLDARWSKKQHDCDMVEFLSPVSFFHISLQPKTVQSLQSSVPKKNFSFTQFHGIDGRGWATRCTEISIEQTIQQVRICMFFLQENYVSTALCSSTQLFLNRTLLQARALSGLFFVNRHGKASKQMLENGWS